MFSFSWTSRNLLISSFISLMTHSSLSNVLFSFQLFASFLLLFLLYCGQTECMELFLFFYICWGLLCALRYDQFWRRFHGLLRRIYIVQKLDEIFWTSVRYIWCMVWFSSKISLLIFCLDDLSIGDRGVLQFPTSTVLALYIFLGLSQYDWWKWVCWHWVHMDW
jgi:hypothetical protein